MIMTVWQSININITKPSIIEYFTIWWTISPGVYVVYVASVQPADDKHWLIMDGQMGATVYGLRKQWSFISSH